MDVVDAEQAKIAEDAGASAVMALERVPSDIRRDGGVARMSDPAMIKGIQAAVTIPVMAKARIGHFAEAQVLEALEVDYIDESEVLTPADEANHIDKWAFKAPFVCGATNLGEALRRIGEGAALIRSKGEAGTGDIVEAVRHLREITSRSAASRRSTSPRSSRRPRSCSRRYDLVRRTAREGQLPVPLFCAGGIATPADASLVMQLGAQAVFVGSGIFKSEDPGDPRRGDRRGDDALRRPGARRARVRGPRHARCRASRRASSSPSRRSPAAVGRTPRRRPRPPGRVRRARARPAGARRRRARGPRPRGPRGARRARPARRRVDDDDAGHRARGPRGAAARARRVRHADVRHLRRAHHARPRAPRDHGHPRAAQRLRPPGALLRGGAASSPTSRASRSARCSSARRGSRSTATGVEILRASTAIPSPPARAVSPSSRSIPSWARTRGCTSGSSACARASS